MRCCQNCDTSRACRIPEEIIRLERIHGVISKRGDNPWLEARIEQYMTLDVCLADLFGLDDLPSDSHTSHHSVALEMTLQRQQIDAAYAA